MAERKVGARRTASWQVLCLALGLLLFAGLIYGVGVTAVLAALKRLGWLTPLIVIPYLASYLVDSLGWWWILRRDFDGSAGNPGPAPRLPQLFAIRAAGEAVNAITPTAYLGGEPLKAWLLQRHGISLVPCLASVLVSKTALMLTQGATGKTCTTTGYLRSVNISAGVGQTTAPDLEHGVVDVGQHHLPACANRARKFRRHVAGTAGEIEHALARACAGLRRREPLPQPVRAERHQVVHQVVFRRHRAKHVGYQPGLGVFRNFAEAEVCGITLVVGGHRHSNQTCGLRW